LLAPERLIISDIDQIDADHQIVSALNQPTGHYGINPQVTANLQRIDRLSFVTKD
jgi:hypothetical protein